MHDTKTTILLASQDNRVRLALWFDCTLLESELILLRKLPKRERFLNSGWRRESGHIIYQKDRTNHPIRGLLVNKSLTAKLLLTIKLTFVIRRCWSAGPGEWHDGSKDAAAGTHVHWQVSLPLQLLSPELTRACMKKP